MSNRAFGPSRARARITELGSWVALAAVAALGAGAAGAQQATQRPLPPDEMRPPPVRSGLAPQMKVEESTAAAHVFTLRFSTGDEIISGLNDLAKQQRITSAYITGLGGLAGGMLGWGNIATGGFKKVPIDQKAELVSLVGDISLRDGEPYVHVHSVVAYADGSTRGGHMIEAEVNPVAEITVVATGFAAPAH